jgi:hydrogenase maturation protein HypF
MAAAYLETVGHCGSPAVARRHPDEWEAITRLARSPASPVTTSAGRLFDAVAALVGIRDVATYEGQAAIELEQRVDEEEHGAYDAAVDAGSFVRIGGHELVAQAVADHAAGAPVGLIAARFHNGLAVAVARACEIIARRTGLDRVALSGGVFQNLVLLGRTVDELRAHGLRVLTHARVPPNDGGISLGQAAVAAARRGGGS